jgi:hypothetical protein
MSPFLEKGKAKAKAKAKEKEEKERILEEEAKEKGEQRKDHTNLPNSGLELFANIVRKLDIMKQIVLPGKGTRKKRKKS